MGILFAVLASVFAATNNLLLRMSISAGGGSRGYLAIQVLISFFVMILLNPVRVRDFSCPSCVMGLGAVGGIILGCFFWVLGKSMEKGPAGLSIAILNASCLMPAIVLAMFFGKTYGHYFTLYHVLGFLLFLIGVFWATGTSDSLREKKLWLIFAFSMFCCHSLFLTFLQWWAMVLDTQLPLNKLLPLHIDTPHIYWFMPAIFFVAALFQLGVFILNEKRLPYTKEVTYGLMGGAANGLCAYFLILAPQVAAVHEKALLFPIFSVGVIIFCNVWARLLYSERVNWKACAVCVLGLGIGTLYH